MMMTWTTSTAPKTISIDVSVLTKRPKDVRNPTNSSSVRCRRSLCDDDCPKRPKSPVDHVNESATVLLNVPVFAAIPVELEKRCAPSRRTVTPLTAEPPLTPPAAPPAALLAAPPAALPAAPAAPLAAPAAEAAAAEDATLDATEDATALAVVVATEADTEAATDTVIVPTTTVFTMEAVLSAAVSLPVLNSRKGTQVVDVACAV